MNDLHDVFYKGFLLFSFDRKVKTVAATTVTVAEREGEELENDPYQIRTQAPMGRLPIHVKTCSHMQVFKIRNASPFFFNFASTKWLPNG